MILFFAFLIGVIAGLRAIMAPAIVSWAAGLGWIHLDGTPLNFLSHPVTRWIFGIGAVGELFNEIPDRVSDAGVFIGAGHALGGNIELGYLTACLALFLAYVRAEGKVAGAHQEYCGPMAKQHRMMTITVAATVSPFVPEGWVVWPGYGVMAIGLCVILAGGLVTVVRRLARITTALRKGKP